MNSLSPALGSHVVLRVRITSANVYWLRSATDSIWNQALATLSNDDKAAIETHNVDKLSVLKDVLAAVNEHRRICMQRRLRYRKSNGEVVILRDIIDKVAVWVQKFKEIGDIAVQYDPTHAALPWAGVRLLLQIVVGDSQTCCSMYEGVELVSNLISRYTILELLYLRTSYSASAKDELTKAIAKVYAATLTYLAKASRYYTRHRATRLLKSIVQPEERSVGTYLNKISEEQAHVDQCIRLVDAEYRGRIFEGVQYVQTNFQSLTISHERMNEEMQLLQCKIDSSASSCGDIQDRLQKIQTMITTERQNWNRHILDIEESLERLTVNHQQTGNSVWALQALRLELHQPIMRTAMLISELHDSLKKTERRELFQWLSTVPHKAHHINVGKSFLPGTGAWLKRRPEFLNWRKSSSSAIIWLHGIPGSGKSKLVYSIIEVFSLEAMADPSSAPIAYFYCARNAAESKRANPDEIMRSILKQLACTKSDLPVREPVAKIYKERKEIADDNGCEIERLEFAECVQCILALLESTPATIIIDALDECDSGRRYQLLKALDDIIQQSTSLVKIFVSSRDDKDIVCRLEQSPNVFIHASDNIDDIKYFVKLEVEQSIVDGRLLSGDVSEDLKNKIISTLVSQADGMFRWVSLQIENLCDSEHIKHEMDIRTELGRLPKTLKASYDVTFKRIESSASTSRSIAQNAMKWLMCAQRPLVVTEFIAAVSMDSDGNSVTLSVSELLHMCCNMVMLDHGLNIFRLVHLSVREYLEAREDYSMAEAHGLAAARCINTFIYELRISTTNSNVFPKYAALYWPTHYKHLVNAGDDVSKEKIETFLLYSRDLSSPFAQWASMVSSICELLPWTHPSKAVLREARSEPPSPLFLASCLGLPSVLGLMEMHEAIDLNQQNSNKNTALHLGVAFEQEAVVRSLLNRNVDLELEDKDGKTALSLAAELGRESILRLLLENGASVKARDWHNRTPLQAAIAQSRGVIIGLMLKYGSDIEARDKDGRTVLHLAAILGRESIVNTLLEKGAKIEARDWHNRTPLHVAAIGMQNGIVELLLQCGADIESRDLDGKTALHLAKNEEVAAALMAYGASIENVSLNGTRVLHSAAANNLTVMTQRILNMGVEIDARRNDGMTALQIAAGRRHIGVMKLLLKKGAGFKLKEAEQQEMMCTEHHPEAQGRSILQLLLDLGMNTEAKGVMGEIALHSAAARGAVWRIRLLLQYRADIEAKDDKGNTPLHLAAWGGWETIVRILLEHGADIEAEDDKGNTPLHHAALEVSDTIVRTLIDNRADIEARNADEETPLHLAVLRSDRAVVRLFCEKGANIEAKDGRGRTPLYRALESETGEVLNVLREKGAVEYEIDLDDDEYHEHYKD